MVDLNIMQLQRFLQQQCQGAGAERRGQGKLRLSAEHAAFFYQCDRLTVALLLLVLQPAGVDLLQLDQQRLLLVGRLVQQLLYLLLQQF
ncbi:hypothetical protein D3C80_1247700 [compost metagenome]